MSNGKTPRPTAALILLSGLPASGKTTFARAIAARTGARHVESDAVRRALFPAPRYVAKEHRRVFDAVERQARAALRAGRPAVVDATNLTVEDRRRFALLAQRRGVPLVAVRMVAPEAVLRARLAVPRDGWSQADARVLDEMRGRPQPFTLPVVVIDSRFDIVPSVELVLRLAGSGTAT